MLTMIPTILALTSLHGSAQSTFQPTLPPERTVAPPPTFFGGNVCEFAHHISPYTERGFIAAVEPNVLIGPTHFTSTTNPKIWKVSQQTPFYSVTYDNVGVLIPNLLPEYKINLRQKGFNDALVRTKDAPKREIVEDITQPAYHAAKPKLVMDKYQGAFCTTVKHLNQWPGLTGFKAHWFLEPELIIWSGLNIDKQSLITAVGKVVGGTPVLQKDGSYYLDINLTEYRRRLRATYEMRRSNFSPPYHEFVGRHSSGAVLDCYVTLVNMMSDETLRKAFESPTKLVEISPTSYPELFKKMKPYFDETLRKCAAQSAVSNSAEALADTNWKVGVVSVSVRPQNASVFIEGVTRDGTTFYWDD